jgi:thiopeptide-type bacteriocin biosynthesis protein
MRRQANLVTWVETIYEPETHAFGGPEGMDATHELFPRDSRSILDYLARESNGNADKRRELSVLLCSAMMRSAGQEWPPGRCACAAWCDHAIGSRAA